MNVRAFVAIDLPVETRETLVDACDAFLSLAPSWREDKWVAAENLHVTVKFIGAVPECDVAAIRRVLEGACAPVSPFTMRLDGFRAVPNLRRATMLWGVFDDGTDESVRVAGVVDGALAPLDIPEDDRRFVPHVTLVRARKPRPVPEDAFDAASSELALTQAASCPAEFVSVTSLTLYSSTLGPSGPTYEPLASIPLLGEMPS